MGSHLFTELAWLPKAPADFNAQCRALSDCPAPGKRLRALASAQLNANRLCHLADAAEKLRTASADLQPLVPFRLGLLSNATVDLIVPALVGTAPRHGIALECIHAGYGQVMQEALSSRSSIRRANPDAVLVAIDYRALPLRCQPGSRENADEVVRQALACIESIRVGLKDNGKTICILQTIPSPTERVFGSLDRVLPGTLRTIIDRVNLALSEAIAGTEDILLDVAGVAETVGLSEWHSPAEWNCARLPFSQSYLPLYADHVLRLLSALRGKSRRVLVLDLDNTLWGGVIGDDGIEGIQCAQGDAAGEAYRSVQRMALELRERGIVLAVSSKNHDHVARQPFRSHPEMLLREEHIAVFQANWSDKATNLTAIARELSLGLDSMVFLDDNPVERNLVRRLLPDVAVPELPSDPALYARTLAAAGYFESVVFSSEDLKRASYYQDNARRVELQKQTSDVAAYLASLRMEITFQPFDEAGRARITQLINKSNQFNLTTRRYTEAEVAAIERDPDCFTLQVRLSDAYGDNGMISVVICRSLPDCAWEIDTWLMSCRVLGRDVEHMVLRQLLDHAKRLGIRHLVGVYRPTDRNQLVKDHYAKLGFSPAGAQSDGPQSDGPTTWLMDVQHADVKTPAMTLHSIGFLEQSHAQRA